MSKETLETQAGGQADNWTAAMAEQDKEKTQSSANVDEEETLAGTRDTHDDYERASFKNLDKKAGQLTNANANLNVILDIPVTLSMEVGRTELPIHSLLQLNQGSVVELDRLAGEPMDVLINGTLIAHGEVVVVNEKFGIRLTDVISPAERVKKLK
ncbi:MAG: flagellar motor switch protein FliN [Gammaproteobacteria bacterium]|nr:flagellar motor switch protein FliN [Gammaproteobacteria bacterium]